MNQTLRARPTLKKLVIAACAMGLFVTACSTDTAETVEAIETNNGAISVKPPDVLAGEADDEANIATATTLPVDAVDPVESAENADATEQAPSDSGLAPIPPNEFVWFDGSPGSTDEFAGMATVVNFWSSNCAACVAEMPDFEEVSQELAGRVAFVGMNRDDTRDFALQLAAETGVTYPLAEDIDSKIFTSFRAFAMPTTVFLNSDAEVAFVWQGSLTDEELLLLIDKHLQPGKT